MTGSRDLYFHRNRDTTAHEAVAQVLGLSDADKAELLPSGQQPVYQNRNGWAHHRLKRAGLSESSAFGIVEFIPDVSPSGRRSADLGHPGRCGRQESLSFL